MAKMGSRFKVLLFDKYVLHTCDSSEIGGFLWLLIPQCNNKQTKNELWNRIWNLIEYCILIEKL